MRQVLLARVLRVVRGALHPQGLGADVLGLLHPGLVHIGQPAMPVTFLVALDDQVGITEMDVRVVLHPPDLLIEVALVLVDVGVQRADPQALLQFPDQCPDLLLGGVHLAHDDGFPDRFCGVMQPAGLAPVGAGPDIIPIHFLGRQVLLDVDVVPAVPVRQEIRRLRMFHIEVAFIVRLVAGLAFGDERGKCHAAEYSAF